MAMNLPRILVVDDDVGITALLCEYLARFRLEALAAHDGLSMRAQLARGRVDLVVLDLMLPGTDGLQLAQELRAHSQLPIIMLSARGGAADRIVGLEAGVDDYLTKPFEPRELVARIHTVLRRRPEANARAVPLADLVCFDGWQLQRGERRLTSPSGVVVALSNAEFRLLTTFLRAPGRVISRDQLMASARGRTMDGAERGIDLLVSRLRQKLLDVACPTTAIKTVRGAGYLFEARVHEAVAWSH